MAEGSTGVPRPNFGVSVTSNGFGVDRLVAIHEAGHAVGLILIAPMLGWRYDEVLNRIEVQTTPVPFGVSQATTSGPFLSKPMEDYCRLNHVGRSFDVALFAGMRAAGLDLASWFNARCIALLFGSIAEARATGRTLDEVIASDASEGDLNDVICVGKWCGMTTDEIQSAIWDNAEIAARYVDMPEVWGAILALARKLRSGTMTGERATTIVIEALTA